MAPSPQPIPEASGRSGRWEILAAGGAMFLFLAWLFLPLALAVLRRPSARGPVKVKEAIQRPVLGGRPLADFLRDFALYYERSNPVRPLLIPRFMAFKLYTLGLSSVSSVVVGRENWLFVGHETDKIDELRYFLGCRLMSEETMARWLQVLSERQRWLERRGIAYLLIIAPNKSTIYPEYMPVIYPRGRRTSLDQLSGFMERNAPGFPWLDLRPVMKAGKKTRLIYWPADTHWNDFGKQLAYREIVRVLSRRFPSLEALPQNSFAVIPCAEPPHDLEELLLLPCKARVPLFRLVAKRPLPSRWVKAAKGGTVPFWEIYRSRAAALPLALVIHDSFGESLKPLVASHFRRSRWVLDRGHGFPAAWIERKRPCLVIDEVAERYLDEDPWRNLEGIRE
jgi:alginate O-acetyltransferase complex protein AlgJ